ncbi:hypothetical protein [Clostridium tunisiense]|uniref:hypothetical protein n=1 Tax=Clostridium tunisiense TaxID=219748 RepID=UPI0003827789|nr:hypothetical protein [Clostridium tunisiense]
MINTYKQFIQVRDKYKLMEALLEYQSRGLCISFEGKLLSYDFSKIGDTIKEEYSILRRNVIEPKSDFFVFDLNKININSILKIIKVGDVLEWDIFHIKIADTHEIVFESYDWFSDCYLSCNFYNSGFINNLVCKGIIKFA